MNCSVYGSDHSWIAMNRKKLDPLDAYVPAVILTQLQIKDLGNFICL